MINSEIVVTFATLHPSTKPSKEEVGDTWRLIADLMVAVSAPRFRKKLKTPLKFKFSTLKNAKNGDGSYAELPMGIEAHVLKRAR